MNLKYKVTILVEPTYLEDHSDPSEDSYLWAYTVKIKNNSNKSRVGKTISSGVCKFYLVVRRTIIIVL